MGKIDLKAIWAQAEARHLHGGDFILNGEDEVPAIWGNSNDVLWADGEALMLAGGVGTGKSTIVQQLILHGIGVRPGTFLGYDVRFWSGSVVGYVAADRPSQIRRSLRRMVDEGDRQRLDDRLDFWRGAFPFDLSTADVGALADFVDERGWETVVIDSLKDVTGGMSQDEDGAAINRQFQELMVRGKQLVVNHHDRKGDGRKRSKTLDDIYGSRWLTAGFGSVLYVEGDPGDEVVTLRHLKQPADPVGPYILRHDHSAGTTVIDGMVTVKPVRSSGQGPRDAVEAIRQFGGRATAQDVADALEVSRRQANNYLNKAQDEGLLAGTPGRNTSDPVVWQEAS